MGLKNRIVDAIIGEVVRNSVREQIDKALDEKVKPELERINGELDKSNDTMSKVIPLIKASQKRHSDRIKALEDKVEKLQPGNLFIPRPSDKVDSAPESRG
ncbi:MAG: hypothetical protein F4206_16465 [Gammaproteobacteria bacterium]|nr:hypothetical protein [Gammaproteobacteria bacterium]MYG68301.1 hypothetical protein [Gammaproteobacteria bacterium]